MTQYRIAIGTHDPHDLSANGDIEAVQAGVTLVRSHYAEDLNRNPQEVATLIGPEGLVTRPGERIDEFVARVTGPGVTGPTVQPGDSNTPDCNGD